VGGAGFTAEMEEPGRLNTLMIKRRHPLGEYVG
jgi:hypothetical protein